MDPSTPAAQDAPNQSSSDNPVNPVTVVSSDDTMQSDSQTQPPKQQLPKHQQISVGGVEAGAVVEDADEDDDDDEELMVAPQETKNRAVLGQNEEDEETITVAASQQVAADVQENVEIQPSASEMAVTGSPEVEKVIELTADQEKPVIPQEVQDAGVTHSGPGVIVVEQQNNFGITQMPVSYQQAAIQLKKTKIKQSKHWLMGMIMYVWRKMNPKLGTKGAEN